MHDLGVRRHERVERLGLHHLDRLAVQRARKAVFVDAVGHLARRGEQQRRRSADEHGRFQRTLHPPRLLPLDREMLRRHVGGAADAVFGFDHAAIDAEIVRAGLGIARHPHARGDERRGIEAGRRHEMREAVDAAFERRRAAHDLLHRRVAARRPRAASDDCRARAPRRRESCPARPTSAAP